MRGEVFLPDAVRLALEAKKSRQDLSPRQMDVLRFLAKGLLDKEIAERMKLSERTVSHYCGAIYQKLGAANRTEAVTLALKQGLVSADRG
jgi:DNA-binding NarL/FixJ family response regulator